MLTEWQTGTLVYLTKSGLTLRTKSVLYVLVLSLAFSAGSAAFAVTAGDLDIRFGTGGKVVTPFPNQTAARAVAIQLDGKVVMAGGQTGFNIARYDRDGMLDPSFGNGGKQSVTLGPWTNYAHAIAVQLDGKIVVAGESDIGNIDQGIVVMRFNEDGSFDNSFGGDGIVSFSLGGNASVGNSLAIRSNGSILVAGSTSPAADRYDFIVMQITPNGTLDSNFGNGGVVTEHSGDRSIGIALALQSDGRIVVGGTTYVGPFGQYGDWDFMMERYLANGTRDLSFGSGGRVISTIGGGQDIINGLAIQPDGKIVAAGSVVSDSIDLAIVRYTAAGQLDAGNFGSGGKVLVDFSGRRDYAFGVAVDPSRNIVAAGFSTDGAASDVIAVRCEPDGDLDPDFGTGGKVRSDFGGSDQVYGMALQPTYYPDFASGYRVVTAGQLGFAPGQFGSVRFYSRTRRMPRAVVNDFNGDEQGEIAVFKPNSGDWLIGKIPGLGAPVFDTITLHWGASGDRPVPSDYDADGKYDLAVYRGGVWHVLLSFTNTYRAVAFGLPSDVPVPADYDGDGRNDIAVFRPANGGWYWLRSSDSTFAAAAWGLNDDKPVPGYYDGDDRADLAVFRGGVWYILNSTNAQLQAVYFGISSDQPVPFDYDRDGSTDIGVFRNGDWYYRYTADGSFHAVHWGQAGDIPVPVPGDIGFTGPMAIFRNGFWWVLGQGMIWNSGPSTDVPLPSYYAR